MIRLHCGIFSVLFSGSCVISKLTVFLQSVAPFFLHQRCANHCS